MRKWICLGLGLLAAAAFADNASAQGPFAQNNGSSTYERPKSRYETRQAERQRLARTRRLIYQRAVEKAQQRTWRIEAREWAGVSAARPTIQTGVFGTRLTPDPWAHWAGFRFRLAPRER